MASSYIYNNKATQPDLVKVHTDVTASTMLTKTISYCRWDAATEILSIFFETALSISDEDKLDTIVNNN